MGFICTVVNQKGGVGKTTTAVNLAAQVAAWGLRVLLVDGDPQGNATSHLGLNPRELPGPDLYRVLGGAAPAGEALVPTPFGVHVLPASPDLAGAGLELPGEPAWEGRLREALLPLRDRFDLIFVDSPPSLGPLTVLGLVAADGVLIPLQAEYLALEGLAHLIHTLRRIRAGLNPGLALVGIVLTLFDRRTRLALEVAREVRRHFPRSLFRTLVPRNVRLSEAPSHGLPIRLHAPGSPGDRAYRALAAELLGRLQIPVPREEAAAPTSEQGP